MNLPDLLRRKDRAAKLEAGTAEPCNLLTRWGTQRAVRLSPNASLRLIDAHQYSALRGFPSDLHWQLLEGQGLRVTAMPHAQDISPASVALICAGQRRAGLDPAGLAGVDLGRGF